MAVACLKVMAHGITILYCLLPGLMTVVIRTAVKAVTKTMGLRWDFAISTMHAARKMMETYYGQGMNAQYRP